MPDARDVVRERLRSLRDAYVAQLPARLGQIARRWRALEAAWDANAARELHRMVHSLAGSGTTFGCPGVSARAYVLELELKQVLDGRDPAPPRRRAVSLALDDLERAVASADRAAEHESDVLPSAPPPPETRRVVVVGDADDVAAQLRHYGFAVDTAPDLDGLAGGAARAAAVIVDLPRAPSVRPASLQAIRAPILFVCDADDVASRLDAVRAGAHAYFTRPLDAATLVDRLDELVPAQVAEPYRVLIVEDDALLAAHNAVILEQGGMRTETVGDPLEIAQPLSRFRPDLILMDLYMQGCGGLDLAAVVRQYEEFVGVPIVFLSTETDIDKRLAAMVAGCDDFLTRPISAARLVFEIAARVKRARLLRSFMMRDSLTRLLNHSSLKSQLEIEISRAARRGGSLAYVLLDVDRFKDVNDTYGHRAGDRVLKSLARLLQQRVRRTDAVGRCGGDEFAVLLADADGRAAAAAVDEMRLGFEGLAHRADGAPFAVTFSAGIAIYPARDTAVTLHDAADRALYDAKRAGRNRVIVDGA
jgi:diguanylate cyclase (GGDEF)-like protein